MRLKSWRPLVFSGKDRLNPFWPKLQTNHVSWTGHFRKSDLYRLHPPRILDQLGLYTQPQLKYIIRLLAKADADLKTGQLKDTAANMERMVFNIIYSHISKQSCVLMAKPDYSKLPSLVVSDACGNLFDIPELKMCAASGIELQPPVEADLIPLPFGSSLFELPGRIAIGLDPATGKPVRISKYRGKPVFAAAAFIAPAYTQLLRLHTRLQKTSPCRSTPITAIGWRDEGFVVPAVRVDADKRQDLCGVDLKAVEKGRKALLKKYPDNRLIGHLMNNCVHAMAARLPAT